MNVRPDALEAMKAVLDVLAGSYRTMGQVTGKEAAMEIYRELREAAIHINRAQLLKLKLGK